MHKLGHPNVCPQCGGKAEPAFEARDVNRRISDAIFSYLRCGDCGVVYLSGVPANLGDFYPFDYYTIARSKEELAAWSNWERYKIDIVRKFRSSGHLTEIGPASGAFAYLAKTAGFSVTAIEMDPRCCASLRDMLGIDVVESANEAQALAQTEPSDVIAMWHVIEHLVDPWSMLEVAAAKLRPGGVLVIAAPNPSAFQFGVLGRRWAHVDAPRHLWLIPPEVIVERSARLGLSEEMRTTRDVGSLFWNRFGWEYSLAGCFTSGWARKFAGATGRATAALLAPFESLEGKGAAYTVVLRRPGA
jgi:SAM-dependent methyltransferase